MCIWWFVCCVAMCEQEVRYQEQADCSFVKNGRKIVEKLLQTVTMADKYLNFQASTACKNAMALLLKGGNFHRDRIFAHVNQFFSGSMANW